MNTRVVALAAILTGMVACRPSDVLSVPPPAGVVGAGILHSQAGAESQFNAGKATLFGAADGGPFQGPGVLYWSELMTDEFLYAGLTFYAPDAAIDARLGGDREPADNAYGAFTQARSELLAAVPALMRYEPASARSTIGEAHALLGYAELLLAEDYCAGTPLDQVVPNGAVQYGVPLSTDSLLGVATAHFDSASAEANGNPSVAGLAGVGLGRALTGRGQYAAAAAAVRNVPTSFVYNVELEPSSAGGTSQGSTLYAWEIEFFRTLNVPDRKGMNGLNFASAHDPRLALDTTTYMTWDGTPWRLPMRFAVDAAHMPLATGIEARLIEAEAALKAGQPGVWLTDLNALRNSGCTVPGVDSTCAIGTGQVPSQTTGLSSLADPGTDSGRVSLMFRERGFWLFGAGGRLGDLRRLVRQYGRDQSTVFPSGPYENGQNPALPTPIPNYGSDVSLTLPTPAGQAVISNPNYKGCLTSTKTA